MLERALPGRHEARRVALDGSVIDCEWGTAHRAALGEVDLQLPFTEPTFEFLDRVPRSPVVHAFPVMGFFFLGETGHVLCRIRIRHGFCSSVSVSVRGDPPGSTWGSGSREVPGPAGTGFL
jgi:hypothetical protein